MSHVKASPIASACQNPMSIFSRGFGLAFLGSAVKIIETEPRRARKRDADGNARLVLKEITSGFGPKSSFLLGK